jgi:N-acetylneuraminic acid mutarotase
MQSLFHPSSGASSPSGGLLAPKRAIPVIGGADGGKFLEIESLGRQIGEAKGTPKEKVLEALKGKVLNDHPGFSRDVLECHPETDLWTKAGEFPAGSPFAATPVEWEGAIVIPSGEIRPGVRSPKVWQAALPRCE